MAYYFYKRRAKVEFSLLVTLFWGMFYSTIITSSPDSHKQYQTYVEHNEMPLRPKYRPSSLIE